MTMKSYGPRETELVRNVGACLPVPRPRNHQPTNARRPTPSITTKAKVSPLPRRAVGRRRAGNFEWQDFMNKLLAGQTRREPEDRRSFQKPQPTDRSRTNRQEEPTSPQPNESPSSDLFYLLG